MSKFTPGPWSVGEPNNPVHPVSGGCSVLGIHAPDHAGGWILADIQDDMDDESINPDANAHLIAAAPELYEAVKAFIALDRTFDSVPDAELATLERTSKAAPLVRAVMAARTALAKAEGKA